MSSIAPLTMTEGFETKILPMEAPHHFTMMTKANWAGASRKALGNLSSAREVMKIIIGSGTSKRHSLPKSKEAVLQAYNEFTVSKKVY